MAGTHLALGDGAGGGFSSAESDSDVVLALCEHGDGANGVIVFSQFECEIFVGLRYCVNEPGCPHDIMAAGLCGCAFRASKAVAGAGNYVKWMPVVWRPNSSALAHARPLTDA